MSGTGLAARENAAEPSGRRAGPRTSLEPAHRKVALAVGLFYFVSAFWIFRDILTALPAIISGDRVLVGDELVPFFNPTSQLFEQAKGEYSALTNGYEFRVRYSFLTTWLRHYQVLPFAILIVLPSIVWGAYLTTAWFMSRAFRSLSKLAIYTGVAFPTALIYMIVIYAKVTHFYTLVLGLLLMMISSFVMLDALLFRKRKWAREMAISCAITLLNPAVHYLVLFSLFLAITTTTLLLGELARLGREGHVRRARAMARVARHPRHAMRAVRKSRLSTPGARARIKSLLDTTTGRCAVSLGMLMIVAVAPYGLFVKYIALRDVANLAETVPGDYYFIRDASVSLVHVLSWDLAGIMDKIKFGDYLAKTPRVSNMIYMLLALTPLVVPGIRRSLFRTRAHRQLLGVICVNVGFAIWATVGYGEPTWLPTFHRSLAAVTRTLHQTDSSVGDLALTVSSSIVQVLRFPHRFQLLLFMLGPMLMALPLCWAIDRLHGRALGSDRYQTVERRTATTHLAISVAVGSVFFVPFFSNGPYSSVYGSGDFDDFFSAYPVADLKELKEALLEVPEGRSVVLPPTETAKLVVGSDGVAHKFIDKFYIYYLDEPSFYYGLTGDSRNKFEFFLLLRSLYYQQDWWINIARDIGLDYLVFNKQVENNRGIGAEYLPDLETYLRAQIEAQPRYVETIFENQSYVLYRLRDPAPEDREVLLFDTSWKHYLDTVFARLNLSRCYDFQYLPQYKGAPSHGPGVNLIATDPEVAAIDLWALDNHDLFFVPSPKTFAFNSGVISSAYYLSPMFRLYLFFSDTKWNRTEMITPGLFGTLRGSFIGLPGATQVTVPVAIPDNGRYRVLLRGSTTANTVEVRADSLGFESSKELRSPGDALQLVASDAIYETDRRVIDGLAYSVEELEQLVPEELVPVNLQPIYHDMGTVDAAAGLYPFIIDKADENPMLLEGLLLIPEHDHATLAIPPDVRLVTDVTDLDCSELVPARRGLADGVEAVANDPNADLDHDELLELLGVDELAPPQAGGLGGRALHLIGTALIVVACWTVVRWRARVDPGRFTDEG
jgi:hypothetical protein